MLPEKVEAKIDRAAPGGCWLWTGGKNSWGYGCVNFSGKSLRVHRVVYEAIVGPIPAGLHLDHLCRNRACCNPAHLEPVTHAENLRRGKRTTNGNERKTHCPQGHEYTLENTYREKNGSRQCRECQRARLRTPERRAYDRARYAAKKAAKHNGDE